MSEAGTGWSDPDNIPIAGGESITNIAAVSVGIGSGPNVLSAQTSRTGDFSTYTLRLVNSAAQAVGNPFDVTDVLTGFDLQLAEVNFTFRIECGPGFDCGPLTPTCAEPAPTPPPINYLAKDYGSFRTLILDRLNQLLPAGQSSNEADLGVVLAELIAYRCDYLSYQQDAIATEAYLETARSRVSLRRHGVLVDYHVHDGCNARAWIQLQVAGTTGENIFLDHITTRFYTWAPGMPATLAGNERAALLSGVQVFEPMQDAVLYAEHNSITFYTWGDTLCCLPQGALEATLDGYYPNLQPGDVLIFQEVLGPQTGNPADADLRHRCAVRLTQIATQDSYGNLLTDPLFLDPQTQAATPITEIQWSQDDALPFPVCISSVYETSLGGTVAVANVSLAYGNVVLADHGLTLSGVLMGTVPESQIFYPPATGNCQPAAPMPVPVRFRPTLADSPLTQAVPLPLAGFRSPPVLCLSAALAPSASSTPATRPASWCRPIARSVGRNTLASRQANPFPAPSISP